MQQKLISDALFNDIPVTLKIYIQIGWSCNEGKYQVAGSNMIELQNYVFQWTCSLQKLKISSLH